MPAARAGFFPLDQQLQLGKHSWTPQTIGQALRLGPRGHPEIASYERAAAAYSDISGIGLSKSSLQQLVAEYGDALVAQQAAEAAAMVKPSAKEKVELVWRQIPEPASETMSVSHDRVMVHLRKEGWGSGGAPVKVVSVAAVEPQLNPVSGVVAVKLTQQSYRAGLWEAASFANQQWVETERRGIPKAKRLACVYIRADPGVRRTGQEAVSSANHACDQCDALRDSRYIVESLKS